MSHAATTLDPGEAGQAAKARAWRALAQIDQNDEPTEASNDLLEALKVGPETPEDTLLAAELSIYSWDPTTYLAGLDVPGTVGHLIADPDHYVWKNFDPATFFTS